MKQRRCLLSAVLSLLLSFSLFTPAAIAEEETEAQTDEVPELTAGEETPADAENNEEENMPEESSVPSEAQCA